MSMERIFFAKGSLVTHKRLHMGSKPFECNSRVRNDHIK